MIAHLASVADSLIRVVEDHGILAIFVLMALDACGLPLASEVIMTFAGAFAAQGHLSLPGAIVAGTAGNVAGSLVAYGLAARWGTPLLLGPGRRVGISPSHLALAQRWFDRRGFLLVFVGRLLPVIRTYISFPAGLARVEPLRFTLLTTLGVALWCVGLASAGYAVGANWEKVSGPLGKATYVFAALVLVALVVWFIRGRRAAAAKQATS